MKVAIRTLCDFAARSGDLDHRYTPAPTADEGIEGHKRVTQRRGQIYKAEYAVSGECQGLDLRGRADGFDSAELLVEEIKTHRGDLSRLNPGKRALHMSQLETYGALICKTLGLSALKLRLTYYDIDNDTETRIDRSEFADTLWRKLEQRCVSYAAWAAQEEAHRARRNNALLELNFPFAGFRSGQRQLAEAVYKTVRNSRRALIEAPTGSGKTLGNLFPALMAMAADNSDRIYFLTSRNTGREAALSALNLIFAKQQKATELRVLVHCSKEDACEHPDRACNGDSCPLASGFYDRLPEAREEAVIFATAESPEYGNILTPQQVREVALKHQLCPYYLSQELTRWCDLVIADINYYFDQHALLHALQQQENWRVTLLIDEAHNLIDRARNMYSGQLSRALLKQVRKTCPPALKSSLENLNRAWQKLLKPYRERLLEKEVMLLEEVPSELNHALQHTISKISDYLADQGGDRDLQDLLFECIAFLNLVEAFDSHSICRLSITGTKNNQRSAMTKAQLGIQNLIPAPFLRPRFENSEAAVLFSATLKPFHFYRDLLGLPVDCLELQVNSPFEASQLEVRIAAGISTKLEDRARSVAPVVERIYRQFRLKPANYLVYVSSFAYLKALDEGFGNFAPDLPMITQEPRMDTRTRQSFVDQFQESGRKIGLAVLGGAFAEGIDLPGTRLEGVFILTLGLPPHDEIHEVLRQRLDTLFGNGYNYAYLYPGMRKVVQAAGRVIRTPEDTGLIELIDQRFNTARTKALLPTWWPTAKVEF